MTRRVAGQRIHSVRDRRRNPGGHTGPPLRRLVVAIGLAIVAAVVARPTGTSAHPLGNFTVNQYTRIEVAGESVRLVHIIDMAEIPAFQEQQRIDTDGNGDVSESETAAYLETEIPVILESLDLTLDGDSLTLRPVGQQLTFPDGQAGLKLQRLELILEPVAPGVLRPAGQTIGFHDDYADERLGWREIVVTHGPGIQLAGIELPAEDTSDELRNYPADLLQSPLDERQVSFQAALVPGADAAASFGGFADGTSSAAGVSRPGGGDSGGRFASLLDDRNLSASGLALSLALAMMWGAAHALSPGHGKTVVGAYLVGSRGTPRHAAFLGMTVTITHTAGVLALGLVTLFASRYILPERLFPWISVASGAVVIAMGLLTLRSRLGGSPGFGHHHRANDHSHDDAHSHGGLTHTHGGSTHSHLPPTDRVSWRALLALGVSGGLIPCPSALVVLLGSIALGRVGFGLALVIAFSLGLAMTLTMLGLAFLYAGRLFETRLRERGRGLWVLRYAPVVGSLALTIAGVAIIYRALGETGF